MRYILCNEGDKPEKQGKIGIDKSQKVGNKTLLTFLMCNRNIRAVFLLRTSVV